LAVEQDGTGTANPFTTTLFRTGQTQVIPQEIYQPRIGLTRKFNGFSVHFEANAMIHLAFTSDKSTVNHSPLVISGQRGRKGNAV
jgi:hypothetical protein